MSIKQFKGELSKGLKRPAYLLSAGDPYLLKEALLSIKRSIPEGQRDFLFSSFDADSPEQWIPPEQILDVLYTVPFMGGRKVVAVENSQKLKKKDAEVFGRYIAEPSPDASLVMLYAGKVKKTTSAALKGIAQISIDVRASDLPAWIKHIASERGIALGPDAEEYLLGTLGPEPGLLSSEVEKLAMSGKKTLSADDIREIVTGGGGYDVFDLVNAIKKRDADRAITVYRTLAGTQDPYGLVGVLNWHYGRMAGKMKNSEKLFSVLREADVLLKSSGGAYPAEDLILKLLRL